MMTANPARFMGLSDRKGTIAPGKDADIVIFDDDIRVSHVLVGGRRIV
jgi:N-acetylglucosamine-6-phosphate deacetylase